MTTKYASASPVEWTVLLYIGAVDNGQAKVDQTLIQEVIGAMIRGASADFVYQFAQADRTLRGAIRPDGHNEVLARGRPIDITDPKNITDFINWATRQFPSRYTALFLKDHGSGWTLERAPAFRKEQRTKGFGGLGLFYDGNTDRYMSTADLAPAIRDTDATRVNVLGFDACEMGAVEVAYEVRAVADFMIATETWEPSSGWPYARILKHLREYAGPIVPRELSREVVNLSSSVPLVALELDWIKPLQKEIGALGKVLVKEILNVASWIIHNSRNNGLFPAGVPTQDIVGFLSALQKAGWPPGSGIASAAEAASKALDLAFLGSRKKKTGGVSIFLPVSGSNDFASYGAVSFARNNHWTEFLGALNVLLLQARGHGIAVGHPDAGRRAP